VLACGTISLREPMNDSTLEQIEVKIAFLERANNELSDVVFRQQREIDALRAQIAALIDRVEAAQSRSDALTPEQERPPHY
jgi:SlyX protein